MDNNEIDKIGYFKGKPISQMTREELLEFAEFAGKELNDLRRMAEESIDFRLDKEVNSLLSTKE